MAGRKHSDIVQERNKIIDILFETMGKEDNIEIINSLFHRENGSPLLSLSEAIALLSHADCVVFAEGWEDARGCRIEHMCAEEYGIERLYVYQKTLNYEI